MSLANENLDLVSFSYNEGKANMVDVLSAQLSWTQAHTNLINAYLSEKMAGRFSFIRLRLCEQVSFVSKFIH